MKRRFVIFIQKDDETVNVSKSTHQPQIKRLFTHINQVNGPTKAPDRTPGLHLVILYKQSTK